MPLKTENQINHQEKFELVAAEYYLDAALDQFVLRLFLDSALNLALPILKSKCDHFHFRSPHT